MGRLVRVQWVPQPLEQVFPFFAEPRNLAVITPPWLGFRVVSAGELSMRVGLRIEYRVSPLGFPQRWVSEISRWDPPHGFVDEQRVGPYRRWFHLHRFVARDGGTEVVDEIEYEAPLGPLARLIEPALVAPRLRKIFDYRARVIGERFGVAA